MNIKVYCDSGGFKKELTSIKNIKIVYYPYENKNNKIFEFAPVSELNWEDLKFIPWERITDNWENHTGSEKYLEILKIVGKQNAMDAKHLDSAYKSRCTFFLTSDKDDIVSKKGELEPLLGFRVFLMPKEWDKLIRCIYKED